MYLLTDIIQTCHFDRNKLETWTYNGVACSNEGQATVLTQYLVRWFHSQLDDPLVYVFVCGGRNDGYASQQDRENLKAEEAKACKQAMLTNC